VIVSGTKQLCLVSVYLLSLTHGDRVYRYASSGRGLPQIPKGDGECIACSIDSFVLPNRGLTLPIDNN
jgi:hypothetical protein